MIPSLAIMIGGYIWVRMLSFCMREGDRAESAVVKAFAIIGMVAVPVLCLIIVMSGQSVHLAP